jgi:hypothetical protein
MCVEDCLKTLAVLNLSLILYLGSAGGVKGQDAGQQTPPTPPPSTGTSSSAANGEPDTSETGRRFSGGITLSVLGFTLIPGKSTSVTNTAGTVTTANDTTGSSSRIGYGLIGQVRITNHFSIDVNPLYRRIGYQFTNSVTATTTTVLNGITTSTTGIITTHSDNRAHLIDVPLVLRYYGSPRRPRGPRWFLEAGGAWRVATGIRTSTDVTDTNGINTCCTYTAATPAHHSSVGIVAGAGFQFIDPLGIHVVPEVRYTRWENAIFDNLTTTMRGNQLEATLSLSF